MKYSFSYIASLLSLCSLLFLSGCQGTSDTDRGPTGTLSGKVAYKGEALKEGTVQLNNPEKGSGGEVTINEDGTFEFTSAAGLVTGTYQVSVVPPMVEKSFGPDTPASEVPKEMPNIPEKYRYPDSSGLSVEIKEGENTLEIEMQ